MNKKVPKSLLLSTTILLILISTTNCVAQTISVTSQSQPFLGLINPVAMTLSQQPVAISTAQVSQTSNLVCKQFQTLNNQNVCIQPEYIEGCQTYESTNTCYKCSNGYLLSKIKKCDFNPLYIGQVTHITGCIKHTTDNVCEVCALGFYRKDGKCELGVRNCLVYNKAGQCTQCQPEYSLMLSQCRHNSILGCKFQTESHTCKECYEPFTLNGQHCDIEECRILNDYGCVSCQCGFYLTAERTCKPISSGCLRYQKGVCKDCLNHYKLKGGVCEIQGCTKYTGNYCQACSDKYELVQGQCHFKNCLDWLNDSCISCKKGFSLSNGICISTTPTTCQ